MKRYILIVCLVLCCALAGAYTRLTPDNFHFFALHGDLGYSALLHTIDGKKSSAGLNGNFGFDYRLYHNDFLFSIGVEGMYERNYNLIDQLDITIPMRDTEGDIFDMHVHVDAPKDIAGMANINVPVLFGGEWGRVYFLVGPKVSVNLYGSTSSDALITTYGEYDRYYDDFYEMPNHQFESNQKMGSTTLPLKWNLNLLAHLEVGARVSHMYRHKQFRINPDKIRVYMAGYVDFGVLNLRSNKGGAPPFDYRETDQGVQFFVQPLLLSSLSDGAVFRNLNVGAKCTVAFELPKHGKSYIYNSNRNYRKKRGGNQLLK